MIEEFKVGNLYAHPKNVHHTFVVGIPVSTPESVTLSTMRVDLVTSQTHDPEELVVKREHFGDWELIKMFP